jgi:acetyltransferase-like isoleucine patch superfamily enzyme
VSAFKTTHEPVEVTMLAEALPTRHPRRAGAPVVHNDGELLVGAGVVLADTPEPVKLMTKPGAVLELGDAVHVGTGTTIAAFGHVRVGHDARIGARCLLLDDQSAAGIEIGDGAWIEDEVTILAGATVAAGARVARGSVVRAGASDDAALLTEVRAAVAAVLPDAADVSPHADLRAATRWTSLAEVQLVVALEDRFGVVLADGALSRRSSLRDIATLVTESRGGPRVSTRTHADVAPSSPPIVEPSRSASLVRRCAAEVRTLARALGWSALCTTLANVLPEWALPHARGWLLRAAGCRIARNASFLGDVVLVGPAGSAARLEVGEGSIIGPRVTFGLDAPVVLGRNVSVSPGATLYTGTHDVGRGRGRMDPRVVARPVVVEDGAWIGMNALVLPGVRVGAGAIVSAGAVVTSDVPPDTLVAGNPATPVRTLPG